MENPHFLSEEEFIDICVKEITERGPSVMGVEGNFKDSLMRLVNGNKVICTCLIPNLDKDKGETIIKKIQQKLDKNPKTKNIGHTPFRRKTKNNPYYENIKNNNRHYNLFCDSLGYNVKNASDNEILKVMNKFDLDYEEEYTRYSIENGIITLSNIIISVLAAKRTENISPERLGFDKMSNIMGKNILNDLNIIKNCMYGPQNDHENFKDIKKVKNLDMYFNLLDKILLYYKKTPEICENEDLADDFIEYYLGLNKKMDILIG